MVYEDIIIRFQYKIPSYTNNWQLTVIKAHSEYIEHGRLVVFVENSSYRMWASLSKYA